MAYKTIRKDGRNITINTETGQEVKPGEGLLGDLLKKSGLTTLGSNLPLMFQQAGRDLYNLPRDISRATIYSDKVDAKGRPLTIAQADPEPYKPVDGIKVANTKTPPVVPSTTPAGTSTSPVGPPTPSADPRDAAYLAARNALTKDSSAADVKATEDAGMAAWAKANPGLASKVKPGQSGYELIQNMRGQGTDAYDANETFKPSDIPESDRQNPVDQATALGITDLKDAQMFKDNAMTALLTASQDPNVTPIVEGMGIPTTTNYAGAFNQADMPDLASMMNIGEQLGDLGIEGPKFAQSQKFKDLFQNTMLGK